jgi:hypothetical protein
MKTVRFITLPPYMMKQVRLLPQNFDHLDQDLHLQPAWITPFSFPRTF